MYAISKQAHSFTVFIISYIKEIIERHIHTPQKYYFLLICHGTVEKTDSIRKSQYIFLEIESTGDMLFYFFNDDKVHSFFYTYSQIFIFL